MSINLKTQKNVKDAARRASEYLKKHQIDVPFDRMLEAMSIGLGYKSWNVVCGVLPKDKKSGLSDAVKVIEAAPKAMPMPQYIPDHLPPNDPEQEQLLAFAVEQAVALGKFFDSGEYQPLVIGQN